MRMTPKYHQLPTGEWSGWPQTREDAIEQNTRFYHPIPCIDHCGLPGHGGTHSTLIYTKTGIHHCCTMCNYEKDYIDAVENAEPTDPTDAVTRGYDYYWTMGFFKHCGHTGKRTIDGKCYRCEQEKIERKIEKNIDKVKSLSPRQKAINAGEKWYMPDHPCRNGHIALTRVNNSECSECVKSIREPVQTIQDQYPDMVIDAKTAESLGFKVYRTGKPCRRGHTGWRYITTKSCIQCLRGEP